MRHQTPDLAEALATKDLGAALAVLEVLHQHETQGAA